VTKQHRIAVDISTATYTRRVGIGMAILGHGEKIQRIASSSVGTPRASLIGGICIAFAFFEDQFEGRLEAGDSIEIQTRHEREELLANDDRDSVLMEGLSLLSETIQRYGRRGITIDFINHDKARLPIVCEIFEHAERGLNDPLAHTRDIA
jgi:hypothetical protein